MKLFKRIDEFGSFNEQPNKDGLILLQFGLNSYFYSWKNKKRPYFILTVPFRKPKPHLFNDIYDMWHLAECVSVCSIKLKFNRFFVPKIRFRFGKLPIGKCIRHNDCSLLGFVFDWSFGSGGVKRKIGFNK